MLDLFPRGLKIVLAIMGSTSYIRMPKTKSPMVYGTSKSGVSKDHEKQEEDVRWMRLALSEARVAFEKGEVPVGALVVREGRIIAYGHNRVEELRDPTAHAEIVAIQAASAALRSKWLGGCTVYVTMEPCAMCAGATVLARVQRLVFGAFDPKAGACSSLMNLVQDGRLNHRVEVASGILSSECIELLRSFFESLRAQSKETRVSGHP